MQRRRRRRPIVKLDEYRRARWMVARGLSADWIAHRLQVSPTTVRAWRRTMDTKRAFAELRRRVMQLPAWQREQIGTEIANASARGWS